MTFSESHLHALEVAARVSTTLSLVGTVFIITTFICFPGFNKPINRLIFLASWGNVLSDVGTFMARAGPRAGPGSALCQFQGFLIQWAHPADMFWILLTSVNVYLVFVKRYDERQLRKLEPLYIGLCYGTTFVPAFIYIFIKTKSKGHVYGDATVWCWIKPDWGPLRFATQYGPVWLCGIITTTIYVMIGSRIILNSRRIQNATKRQTHGRSYNIQVTQEVTIELTEPEKPVVRGAGNAALEVETTFDARGSKTFSPTFALPKREPPQQRSYLRDDGAMLSFIRFGGLSFLAMITTWIGPSANRTYTLIHELDANQEVFVLSLLQAMSLSSQGFWNAVVYSMASLPACRALWKNFQLRRVPPATEIIESTSGSDEEKDGGDSSASDGLPTP